MASRNGLLRRSCILSFLATGFLALLWMVARPASPAQAASPQAESAKLAWIQFQDGFEKAFTVEVPQGWKAKGGLFRLGFSDERVMVDLVSPDGSINIRYGDVSVPSYAVPNQFHSEGQVYDLGAQAQMIAARYRTGPEFVVLYSEARFASLCRNPQSDPADAVFTVADFVPVDASATQSSSGQTAFRCDTSAGPRIAYAYAKTVLAGSVWQAPMLVSFIAPPGQVALVHGIIAHSAQSFHLNPQWIEYQKQMDAQGMQYQRARQQQRMVELQQQVRQFEAQMRAMQSQVSAFERRQNAQAAQVNEFDNALVGVTPTTDPLTGENRLVWSGPKQNYWANGLGQVVNSTNMPAAGWHQLQSK